MPKFVSDRDYDTIKKINKELINNVLDTPIVLFKINTALTETNSYGESKKTEWFLPVQIPCRVQRTEPTVKNDISVIDVEQECKFHFLRQELIDRNVYPSKGDIIQFDNLYYEIDNTIENDLWGGQVDKKHSITCETHLSRRTYLQLEPPNV